MPMRHGGSLPKNSSIWPRLSCFLITGFPAASTPCTWKTFLAISIPIVLICMWMAPSCDSSTTITLWHIDAGSGRRPPHQYRGLTVSSPEGAEGVELLLEPMGFAPAQTYQKALFAAGI